MNIETTAGVRISVEPTYMAKMSNPLMKIYFFSYKVVIENLNKFPIQLLRRHWRVDDEMGHKRDVDGEGVMGKQPLLNPGGKHRYISMVDIRTVKGSMEGYYTMKNLVDDTEFEARIPRFELSMPFHLN